MTFAKGLTLTMFADPSDPKSGHSAVSSSEGVALLTRGMSCDLDLVMAFCSQLSCRWLYFQTRDRKINIVRLGRLLTKDLSGSAYLRRFYKPRPTTYDSGRGGERKAKQIRGKRYSIGTRQMSDPQPARD